MAVVVEGEARPSDGFSSTDGSRVTWFEHYSEARRLRRLAVPAAIGLVLSCWLWIVQYNNNALHHWWFALIPAAVGVLIGMNAYGVPGKRRYATQPVRYTVNDRVRRARLYWTFSALCMSAVWILQALTHALDNWHYGLWFLLFAVPGVILFVPAKGSILTPDALKAKSYFDALEREEKRRKESHGDLFDRMIELKVVRYPLAALCVYGIYYFAESDHKKAAVGVVAMIICALYLARELALWLLGIALVVGIGGLLFAGVAALPVSMAVIFGALIIAGAVANKK